MKSKEEIVIPDSDRVCFEDKECDFSDLHSMEVHDDIYSKPATRRTFLNSEEIQMTLHNEIVMFSAEIEEFNERNKALFKDLIDKMTEAIQKILPDSIVKILKCLPYSDIDLMIQQKRCFALMRTLLAFWRNLLYLFIKSLPFFIHHNSHFL